MASRRDVLVVGGGLAGFTAATAAKLADPSDSVTLVCDEPFTYSRTIITSLFRGELTEDLAENAGHLFSQLQSRDTQFLGRCIVESIDVGKKHIQSRRAQTADVFQLEFDRLVIATGSLPATPQVEGLKLRGVFVVKRLDDALEASRNVTSGTRALVVGGGFVGLEIAEALMKRGINVTIADRLPLLGTLVEEDLSLVLQKRVEAMGLNVVTGVTLSKVGGINRVEYGLLDDEKIFASMVVLATGVRPNIELARTAGIKINNSEGAIVVNQFLVTSQSDTYAAGDCIRTVDVVSGKPVYRPLGSLAVRTGELAGINAAGGKKTFGGSLRRQYDRVFDTTVVSMGLTKKEAQEAGISAEEVRAEVAHGSHELLSGKLPVDSEMRIVAEKATDRLLGWQVVGSSRTSTRYCQSLDEAIRRKWRASELQELGIRLE